MQVVGYRLFFQGQDDHFPVLVKAFRVIAIDSEFGCLSGIESDESIVSVSNGPVQVVVVISADSGRHGSCHEVLCI